MGAKYRLDGTLVEPDRDPKKTKNELWEQIEKIESQAVVREQKLRQAEFALKEAIEPRLHMRNLMQQAKADAAALRRELEDIQALSLWGHITYWWRNRR